MPKVIVYLPVEEFRRLEAEGKLPAEWVRALVREALERRQEPMTQAALPVFEQEVELEPAAAPAKKFEFSERECPRKHAHNSLNPCRLCGSRG